MNKAIMLIIVLVLVSTLLFGCTSKDSSTSCTLQCDSACKAIGQSMWKMKESSWFSNCYSAKCICVDSNREFIDIWEEN